MPAISVTALVLEFIAVIGNKYHGLVQWFPWVFADSDGEVRLGGVSFRS